jgi:hypothetical protein
VAAFEEKATTNPVRQQADWCSDAGSDLPMIRSENASTQPDRRDFRAARVFFGAQCRRFEQGSVPRLRERNGIFLK